MIDVGTGDGRYALLAARAKSDTFVIGIDPATDALAHAARRVARDRTPNLVLLIDAIETVAPELASMPDEVRIHFPWGALLRGVLAEDLGVLDAIAKLPKTGGTLTVLVSVTPRDGQGDIDVDRIGCAYRDRGLRLTQARPLTKADVRDSASSWGKRLDAGGTRPGLYLRFVRD